MNIKPILFSPEMVRALLDGRKTQTRRIVKPQPADVWPKDGQTMHSQATGFTTYHADDVTANLGSDYRLSYGCLGCSVGEWPCPYGKPGDLIWVREACRAKELSDAEAIEYAIKLGDPEYPVFGLDGVLYPADAHFRPIENDRAASERWCVLHGYRGQRGATVPPIHMPRWASRLTLRLTDVRVQRLQEISEVDAKAEGVRSQIKHSAAFADLWDSIYTKLGYGWDVNPWVWCISFEVIQQNVDAYRRAA